MLVSAKPILGQTEHNVAYDKPPRRPCDHIQTNNNKPSFLLFVCVCGVVDGRKNED